MAVSNFQGRPSCEVGPHTHFVLDVASALLCVDAGQFHGVFTGLRAVSVHLRKYSRALEVAHGIVERNTALWNETQHSGANLCTRGSLATVDV